MLIWMRDSATAGIFKFILLGFMVLAVAGLVLMDVGGFFRGTMSSNTIVKGGGINIGIQEFDQTLRRALSAQGIPAAEALQLGLVDQMLQSEIQNRLFSNQSQKLGLEISDKDVMAQISKLAEPLAAQGRSKKEALQQILRTQGFSESEFVGSIRQEMSNTMLRAALSPPATLTSPTMAKELYRYDNEKRDIRVILFSNDTISDVKQPTDEQLENYYTANKTEFLIPETRIITMATLKPSMMKGKIKIADADVRAAYDKNIAAYTKPERRKIDQGVFETEDEAKKILADVTAGKPIKNSLAGEYDKNSLQPELSAPVFAAKKDDVIGPIKTNLGWHIIKIKEIVTPSADPFDTVKDQIRKDLESTAFTEEMFNLGNTIEDRVAGGEKLEALVTEYGMTTEKFGAFMRSGYNQSGKNTFESFADDKDKILESAFDFDGGEIAPIIETADGQYRLIRVDTVTPDAYKPLADVSDVLKKRWVNEQKRATNQALAKSALEELNKGTKIEDVAAKNAGTVKSIANIGRKANPPAPLSAVTAAQIFTSDVGKAFSGEIENGFVVGVVDGVTMPPADTKTDQKELDGLTDLTGRSLSQDIIGEYVSSLTNGKEIKINQNRLQEIYGKQ